MSVPTLPNQWEFRTERDSFARIISTGSSLLVQPDSFKVWTKDGTILTFGGTANSRLLAYTRHGIRPENPTFERSARRVIAAWALSRIEDRDGNAVAIQYDLNESADGSVDMVPELISYGPDRRVQFIYENRPDPIDAFRVGRDGSVHTLLVRRLKTIQVSGPDLLREYRLAYQANSITGRSLLTSISECDAKGNCRNPVQFEWSLGSYDFELIQTDITDVGNPNSGYRFIAGDINGDGADDLIYGDNGNVWKMRLSNGNSGFNAAQDVGIPGNGERLKIRPIDYDRDGRLDLLAEVPGDPANRFALYRSNGSAYQLVPNMDNLPIGGDDGVYSAFFADLAGNGLPDYLAPRLDGDALRWRYRLNLGSRFASLVESDVLTPLSDDPTHQIRAATLDSRHTYLLLWNEPLGKYDALQGDEGGLTVFFRFLNLPFNKLPENEDRRNLHLADVNGDGLQDAIYPVSGLSAQLSSGAGFSAIIPGPSSQYLKPVRPRSDLDLPVRVADFNGDGADDVLIIHQGTPTGPDDFKRGIQLYTWRNGGFVHIPLNPNPAVPIYTIPQQVQPLDFNGDGAVDIAQVYSAPGPRLYLRLLKRLGGTPDQLIRIGPTGIGQVVEIKYATLAQRGVYAPCTGSYPLMCPARGGSIVAEHRLLNGFIDGGKFVHQYTGGRVDLLGRGWLGVGTHLVEEVDRGYASTSTTFDNTTSVVDGQAIVYPFANLPKQISYSVSESSGIAYNETIEHKYDHHLGDGRFPGSYVVVSLSEEDRESEYRDGWIPVRSRLRSFEYDNFGNATKVTTKLPGSDRIDDLTYDNDDVNWLIGHLRTKTTTDCTRPNDNCVTRTSGRDYYPNGNLKEVVREPDDDDLLLRTVIEYGTYGNARTITTSDADGYQRRSSFTYDSLGLYPKTFTNALNHTTSVNVHTGLGVALERRDANGVPTTMKYDRFGELRGINYADGYFTEFHSFGPTFRYTRVPNGLGGTLINESVLLDGLGRPATQSVMAFDGSSSLTKTEYDRLGRIARKSRPFKSGEVTYYTTYSYDRRDRLIETVEPDGVTTRQEYVGLESHFYDGNGNHSYVLERGDGRIDSRYEDDPKSDNWLRTRFEYGPFGLVTRITSPDSTAQGMEYDNLGRRTKHVDPSAGTTTSIYNTFDEVVEEVDGAGGVIVTEHDALGRPTLIVSPDGETTNTWDTATNGLGKLAEAESGDGVLTRYTYDAVGHNSATSWTIENLEYRVDADFDDIGRLSDITYPALPGVTNPSLRVGYYYNAAGYLWQVKDLARDIGYWSAESRNPAGQLLRESWGARGTKPSVVWSDRTYTAKTGLLTNQENRGPNGERLGWLVYDYDQNRNVKLRGDFNADDDNVFQIFQYDSLNRLRQWIFLHRIDDAVTTTFDYDKMGNLLSETATGRTGRDVAYKYGENGAPPHALTSRNGERYTYDGAGRQITGPDRTIAYNLFGLPTQLTHADGDVTEFVYDAGGTRVLKRTPDATEISIAGLFERRITAGDVQNTHYIFADGRVVAQLMTHQATPGAPVTGTEVRYVATDLQGSPVQSFRPDGTLLEENFYDPFGRRTTPTYDPIPPAHRPIRLGYTGHVHDDELNLIDMKGRIYDPVARRFLTPDPFVQAPLFSQSHNRYSYVWNNPATFTDPTGFSCQEDQAKCGGKVIILIDPGDALKLLGKAVDALGDAAGIAVDALGDAAGAVKDFFGGGGSSDDNNQTDPIAPGSGGGLNPTDNLVTPNGTGSGREPECFGYFCGGRFGGNGAGGYFGPGIDPDSMPRDANGKLIINGGPVIDPLAIWEGTRQGFEWLMGGNNAWAPGENTQTTSRMGVGESALKTLAGAAMIAGVRGGGVPGTLNQAVGPQAASIVRDVLKGRQPLSALTAEQRAAAAAYYRDIATRTTGVQAAVASQYNIARAEFLEGLRNVLSRTLPEFIKNGF